MQCSSFTQGEAEFFLDMGMLGTFKKVNDGWCSPWGHAQLVAPKAVEGSEQ